MVFIRSRDQRSARRRLECNENKYKLRFPFKGGSLYHIEISGDNVKIKQHNSDKGDTEIELLEITPNPFNDVVTIHFSLSTSDYVYYEIYNIQGERILESPKRFYFNGHHEITIDLSSYSSAVYFCKIATSSTTRVRKLVLIK
jgi:hypothetical protein